MSQPNPTASHGPKRWPRKSHRGVGRRGQRRLTPAYVPAKPLRTAS